jgi:transcriptional regulator of arginine metabolism
MPVESTRARRQQAILDLVRSGRARTQADLARGLAAARITATQATVSRDIRELGLVRAADGNGYVAPDDAPDRAAPPRPGVLREFVSAAVRAGQMVVVRTPPGSAPLVARALDQSGWNELLGTVAGDDTVLAVCRGEREARRVEARLVSV